MWLALVIRLDPSLFVQYIDADFSTNAKAMALHSSQVTINKRRLVSYLCILRVETLSHSARTLFIIGIEIDRITLTKLDLIKNAFAFTYCSGVSRKYLVCAATNFAIRIRQRLRFRLAACMVCLCACV